MKVPFRADELVPKSRAHFESDVGRFRQYCLNHRLPDFNHASVIQYCESHRLDSTKSVMERIINNIRRYFLDHDHDDPLNSQASIFKKILRGTPQPHEYPPYDAATYRYLIDSFPPTPAGARDKSLAGLIYTARVTMRDLVPLDPQHCTFSEAGLHAILVANPKRDHFRLKRYPDRRYCPVALLENYFELTGYEAPGFRVIRKSRITRTRMKYFGMAFSLRNRFNKAGLKGSIISLRGAMIVVAAQRGVDEDKITDQGHIRTTRTVRRWKRRGNVTVTSDMTQLGF